MQEQSSQYRISRDSWRIIDQLKMKANAASSTLEEEVIQHQARTVGRAELLEYLEFLSEKPMFYQALMPVDDDSDGMQKVGRGGKKIDRFYLLDRWSTGQDAGIYKDLVDDTTKPVWRMSHEKRTEYLTKWKEEILHEHIEALAIGIREYNKGQASLRDMYGEKRIKTIRSKRIIGCTTTGAAMYASELQTANAGIVLVEEAGEVLESHVITALGPRTRQLIMIGDHKQLRPKINSYNLTVEKGEGYDLNRSLFERLILSGTPHSTLTKQHRMCPEISDLIRRLTYPNLLDAPGTLNRPALRGFQDRLIFVDHNKAEAQATELADSRDQNSTSSKRNDFEAQMVLKCVRYLAQQGYGTEDVVILTPYLGQLLLLRTILSADLDPVLSDMDSYDLVRAGLLPQAAAAQGRRPIRLSTIGQST